MNGIPQLNGYSSMPIPVPSLPTPPTAPASRRESGNFSDSEGEQGGKAEGPEKKKRKRHRVALSCIQCKRRKVKCSRTSPCEACVRHGCADECKWEEGSGAEQSQPFAMATDLRNLEARYRTLEKYVVDKLAVNSGELAALLAEVESPPAAPTPAVEPLQPFRGLWGLHPHAGKEEDDAAHVLEELAMGNVEPAATRSPATHMKPRTAFTTIMLSQPIDASERMSFLPAHELLSRLFTSLPSDEVITYLIKSNSNPVMFMSVFHQPTIMAEVNEFIDARSRDNLSHIDPAWLAFFLTLLCGGISELGDFETQVEGVPVRDLQRLSPFWMSAARAALNLSNYFVIPQFRAVCTLLMFTTLGALPFGRNRNQGHGVWLTSAVRQAHALKLHKLGSDETTMPGDDPGLPAGASALKRQMALRVWHQIVSLDTIISHPHTGMLFAVRMDEFDTGPPANINDAELGTEVHIQPRPLNEQTDASWSLVKIKMMDLFRSALLVAQNMAQLGPLDAANRALELNGKFRRAMEQSKTQVPAQMRDVMISGSNARMLRMLRPFANKAYEGDKRYDECVRASIEDAYAVCQVNRLTGNLRNNFVFLLRHNLLAVVTLFQHRFAMIKMGTPDRDAIDTSTALDSAASGFARQRMNKMADIRLMAENGLSLILALREAEIGYRANPLAETFLTIVKRLSHTHLTVSSETLTALANNAHPEFWPASDNPMANGASLLPLQGVEAVSMFTSKASELPSSGDSMSTGVPDPMLSTTVDLGADNAMQFDWSTLLQPEGYDVGGPF